VSIERDLQLLTVGACTVVQFEVELELAPTLTYPNDSAQNADATSHYALRSLAESNKVDLVCMCLSREKRLSSAREARNEDNLRLSVKIFATSIDWVFM